MSDLNALRSLAEVVRCGSVTRAAELLGISQPTVSAHLRQLEKRFDRRLVRKAGRGVEPTAFAREIAAQIDPAAQTLAEILQTYGDAENQPVTIAGPRDYCALEIAPLLASQPSLQARLRLDMSGSALTDAVAEAEIDLAIFDHRPPPQRIKSRELMPDPVVLVAAAGLADMLQGSLLQILASAPVLAENERMDRLVQLAQAEGLDRRELMAVLRPPVVIMDDERALCRLAAQGSGVAAVSARIAERDRESGRLAIAPHLGRAGSMLRIGWSAQFRLRGAARRCRDLIVQHAQRQASA